MSSSTVPRRRPRSSPLRPPGARPPGAVRTPETVPGPLTAPIALPSDDRESALATEVEQLRTAMASRAVIEQAKGVLMLLAGCGEQAAFDLLTHISSHTHRKVRDLAQVLTASAAGRHPLPDDVRAILRDAYPPAGAR